MTRREAVFWDIGGVILDVESVHAGHRRFVERLIQRYGVDVPPDEATATWRRAVGEHFRERSGTEYRSARSAYARGIEAAVGEPVSEEKWLSLFRKVTAEHMEPMPNARETLARIARTDLHQGAVSDVDAEEGRRVLRLFSVIDHFDSITTSEEVGRTKPDPAMFQAALDAAGVDPERAVMIGDRYGHDMEGASRHGITTVAYGAEDGPAVDYRIDDLRELLSVLGIDG